VTSQSGLLPHPPRRAVLLLCENSKYDSLRTSSLSSIRVLQDRRTGLRNQTGSHSREGTSVNLSVAALKCKRLPVGFRTARDGDALREFRGSRMPQVFLSARLVLRPTARHRVQSTALGITSQTEDGLPTQGADERQACRGRISLFLGA
jgi:hypothetical protein